MNVPNILINTFLGYPLRPWLITPVRDPIEPGPEESYQNTFKRARNTIDKTELCTTIP